MRRLTLWSVDIEFVWLFARTSICILFNTHNTYTLHMISILCCVHVMTIQSVMCAVRLFAPSPENSVLLEFCRVFMGLHNRTLSWTLNSMYIVYIRNFCTCQTYIYTAHTRACMGIIIMLNMVTVSRKNAHKQLELKFIYFAAKIYYMLNAVLFADVIYFGVRFSFCSYPALLLANPISCFFHFGWILLYIAFSLWYIHALFVYGMHELDPPHSAMNTISQHSSMFDEWTDIIQ